MHGAWLLMDPSFSFGLPVEMLYRVRHINAFAVNARLDKRLVQQQTCWSDKRLARQVLLIARLLAYEHDVSFRRAFPEDRLPEALSKLKQQFGCEEALILSTCNRVEVIAHPEDG